MLNKTVKPSELEQTLVRLGAKLRFNEAHALYLGALTSTKLGLGPQQLVSVILGEGTSMGGSVEATNAVLGVLFGYWNKLVSERESGRRAYFVGSELPKTPSHDELRAFAERRREELKWFVRGIDAGGDDPLEWGDSGRGLLETLAETGGIFETYVEILKGSEPAATAADLQEARALLLNGSALCEKLITGLMDVTDVVRREALATSVAMHARNTDDGVRIDERAPRVGRNEPCPCGSGKKWKRCCGGVTQAH